MQRRYLIVEDNELIRRGVVDYFMLKNEEIEFDQAETGWEAIRLIEAVEYDLIILDIMLPEMSGFEICKFIRKNTNTPVFFLTALVGEENVLRGYDIGADDYIQKPFSMRELYAKAETVVGRYEKSKVHKILTYEEIEIDTYVMTVKINGNSIELSPKEYCILKFLIENKGKVFERDRIISSVWESDFVGSDRVVDSQIKKLRKSMGKSGDRIKTVFGKGYMIQ